jgi:NADPH-dependent curcumin reductase CurA
VRTPAEEPLKDNKMRNRQVVLKRHPNGIPLPEDFDLVEGSIAEPGDGQMLVRNLFFSLEAAIRGWLDGKANYFEPIPLGGAIRGPSVARVIKSHLAGFEVGDLIFGLHYWEDYSLSDANTVLLSKLSPEPDIPLSYYCGGLGGSGHTAYVGLHEIGKIQREKPCSLVQRPALPALWPPKSPSSGAARLSALSVVTKRLH